MGFPHFSSNCNEHHHLVRDFNVTPRPEIVCLCGSTRFYEYFQKANFDETMAGKIVLSVGFYPHAKQECGDKEHGETIGVTPEEKEKLDELHKRKIDLCDTVFVLNVGGYIGKSTQSEIDYASRIGKPIKYLEFCTNCLSPFIIDEDGLCEDCQIKSEIVVFPNGSSAYVD